MLSICRLSVAAALAISGPAVAQTVSTPLIGSDDGVSNMPKTTATIPDRIRTPDRYAPDGVRVRSNLADEPETHPPPPALKKRF